MTKKVKSKRVPSLFLASIPVFSMLLLLGVGIGGYGLSAEPLIVVSTLIAGAVAIYLGYSYEDIMKTIAEKIGKIMPAFLILIAVGFMIGTWMIGGTIPMLTYFGLKIISPEYIIIIAFVVTALVSICTGTSWGSAGSIGVAFMGVAISMDANLAAVAGAIVSGAYFGDKLSPLSDTTNLASLSVGVELFEHIKHLLYTTIPSFIVAAAVFLIAGFTLESKEVVPQSVNEMLASLSAIWDWNLLYLLPVVVVLVGAIMKKPTVPIMLLASFIAMFNAMFFEGFNLSQVIAATLTGFDVSMTGISANVIGEDLPKLLNRGGMMSMMNTLLIALLAVAFAGTMMVSNSLNIIVVNLLRFATSTGRLIMVTIVTGLVTIGVTSNGQISILIPGETLKDAYIKRKLHPKNLSRTIEDSASIIEPLLPWTAAGAYMAGTLGVSTLSYLPWAIFCYTGIVFAAIWGFTGFGIAKLNESDEIYEAQDAQMIKQAEKTEGRERSINLS